MTPPTETSSEIPTADHVRLAVRHIVATELGLDPSALRDDTDLRAVEGADSVKVLRMIARIEAQHDVELDDADVFGVSTVAGIVRVVRAAAEAPA
jgi:acyl carrier protein